MNGARYTTAHLFSAGNMGLLLGSLIEGQWISAGCFALSAIIFWQNGKRDIAKARGHE